DATGSDIEETRDEIDEGRLPCSAWAHQRDYLALMDFQINAVQHLLVTIVGVVRKADVYEPKRVAESFEVEGVFALDDFVTVFHEFEDSLRCSEGLLEAVVVDGGAADGIVELEESNDEGEEGALGHGVAADAVASQEKKQSDGDGSDEIHERGADGLGAY